MRLGRNLFSDLSRQMIDVDEYDLFINVLFFSAWLEPCTVFADCLSDAERLRGAKTGLGVPVMNDILLRMPG